MRTVILAFILGWVGVGGLLAQKSNIRKFSFFELYGGAGVSGYVGEIGDENTHWAGFKDHFTAFGAYDPANTRISGSLGARYFINRFAALSLQFTPAWLMGVSGSRVFSEKDIDLLSGTLTGLVEFYWTGKYQGLSPYLLFGGGRSLRYYKPEVNAGLAQFSKGAVYQAGLGFRLVSTKAWIHSFELAYDFNRNTLLVQTGSGASMRDSYLLLQYRISKPMNEVKRYNQQGLLKQKPFNRKKAVKQNKQLPGESYGKFHELTAKERAKIERHLKRVNNSKKK